MKSAAFVVAVIAIAAASAGSARAQGAAGVYGVQGAGVNSERGCDGCGARIDSVLAGGALIGVRGTANVGGVSAIVALEAGLLPGHGRADQSGLLFGRQAYVGLTSHSGAITIGRQHNLGYLALTEVGDPYGAGARAENGAVNRAWGVSIGFERGPLAIRAAHQNRNAAPVAPATPMGNNLDAKNAIVAANQRVGSATAYAAYSATRGWGNSPLFNPDNPYSASMASAPSTDSRDVLVGLALPCGPTTLLASYVRKNDRNLLNRDANQVAFGASHALSRHTDFYASYSRITNRNDAGNTVGNGGLRVAGSSALNLGMRHGF